MFSSMQVPATAAIAIIQPEFLNGLAESEAEKHAVHTASIL